MVPVPVPTFEKVMVPVPVPTFEKLGFRFRFRFQLNIYTVKSNFFLKNLFPFYIVSCFTRKKIINICSATAATNYPVKPFRFKEKVKRAIRV
jgi:hypothetical protein